MLPTSSDSLQSPNMPRRRSRCRTDPATVANPLTQTFDVDYLLDCYSSPKALGVGALFASIAIGFATALARPCR